MAAVDLKTALNPLSVACTPARHPAAEFPYTYRRHTLLEARLQEHKYL